MSRLTQPMGNSFLRALVLGAALFAATASQATKPCLPSPCEKAGVGPDFEKCRAAANWVAVGTVTEVVRHPQGPPLSKDFAEFTFNVKTWEKGAVPGVAAMRFQVGWCENRVSLPAKTEGLFRFYGAPAPATKDTPWQYLYFERQ